MGDTSRAIAKIISAEVARNGLTQQQVADMLGFSQQHVSNLLRGNVSITVDELTTVCDGLGLPWLEVAEKATR